jgi:hypothetical protein
MSKIVIQQTNKQTRWHLSANELYRPNDRRLSAKLVPTFADTLLRGQHNGSLLLYSKFPGPDPLHFFQAAPQLYSRGRVDPVRDPLLLKKVSSA